MKRAVLISAGRGSRLGAITDDSPKCLARVAGRAIIDHQIAALKDNGVEDIYVVVGFRHEAIAQHLAHINAAVRPKLIVNPFWSVSSSIASVWAAREVFDGPFCLINGDTIFDAELLHSALARVNPGLNLLVDKGPLEPDDMRVKVEGERVAAVSKDLPEDEGLYRSLGVIVSTAPDGGSYPGALERVITQPNGRLSYHHAVIDLLAKEETVSAVQIDKGCWREIDRPEDIRKYEESAACMEKAE